MNKHLIFAIIAIATLCVACDKNKDNVENDTSNPYPYLRISDIEVYYGMNTSAAEELIFSKGYQGGFDFEDRQGESYKYYIGNDTIYLVGGTSNTIKCISYYSSLKVLPSEAREWLLHPTETYTGKYTYKFTTCDWTEWQSFVSQCNSSQDVFGQWESETNGLTLSLWYEYLGIGGGSMNVFACMQLCDSTWR